MMVFALFELCNKAVFKIVNMHAALTVSGGVCVLVKGMPPLGTNPFRPFSASQWKQTDCRMSQALLSLDCVCVCLCWSDMCPSDPQSPVPSVFYLPLQLPIFNIWKLVTKCVKLWFECVKQLKLICCFSATFKQQTLPTGLTLLTGWTLPTRLTVSTGLTLTLWLELYAQVKLHHYEGMKT